MRIHNHGRSKALPLLQMFILAVIFSTSISLVVLRSFHMMEDESTDGRVSLAVVGGSQFQQAGITKAHDEARREHQSANGTVVTQDAKRVDASTVRDDRPPLDSLIGDEESNITGDPQFLLDFAIVGYAKSGTSTMMHWLAQHEEAQVLVKESYELLKSQPANLVKKLYSLPSGNFKRGYKSPNDVYEQHIHAYFRQYFPQTRMIVGLRHPIRWFESFYNFKQNNFVHGMPSAETLIGRCTSDKKGLCTHKARFHMGLAKLGKTDVMSEEERRVEPHFQIKFNETLPYTPNKVFLFTTDQLADMNETRTAQFRKDVQKYLGFEKEMPPIPHVKPGKTWDAETQAEKDSRKIDICNPQYKELRAELLHIARIGSEWIRTFFLKSQDVVVSSRDYFEESMESWMHDPCEMSIVEEA